MADGVRQSTGVLSDVGYSDQCRRSINIITASLH